LSVDEKTPVAILLSEGQRHDAPQGRILLESFGSVSEILERYNKDPDASITLIADKAHEGNKTRKLAILLGYDLCIPPKANRIDPWEYDEKLYKRRNEIERLIRRVKEYRRVFTRYDKLDIMYIGFLLFGFIVEAFR